MFPTSCMKTVHSKLPILNRANISVSWKILINVQFWPSYLLRTPFAFHIMGYYPARLFVGAVRLQPGCVIRLKPVYQSASQLYFSEAQSVADLTNANALCHTGNHRARLSVIRLRGNEPWWQYSALASRGTVLPFHHQSCAARRSAPLAGAICEEC